MPIVKYSFSKVIHRILIILFCLFSTYVSAGVVQIGGVYYNLIDESAEVASNPNNYSGEIVIPSSVSYGGYSYRVTSIGRKAFDHCNGLTSVTIPSSVTSIGSYAFAYCSGLTSVTIPNSVTSIGSSAFDHCSGLTSLTIPNSVTSIGSYAFSSCSGLTSVTIPNSVTSISSSAFSSCSGLTSLTIPNSVTSIGSHAFSRCSGLTSVTIPNSVTSIGEGAFNDCSGLTSVTIPNSVTSIGKHAFQSCIGLTSVTIPNRVTSIREGSFSGCNGLTSVTIPNSVISIETCAFQSCSGLTSVTIPNSVTYIGYYAFLGCSGLTTIKIGSGIKNIYSRAFGSCKNVADVYCQATNVPETYSDVFEGSYIEYSTLHVPESAISSYREAAPWSGFKTITDLSNSGSGGSSAPSCTAEINGIYYTLIGKGAIAEVTSGPNKYSGEIVIPSSVSYEGYSYRVTSIRNNAFQICSGLTSVTIPNSVTSIGAYAFSGCSGLTTIKIGSGIKTIASYAFASCKNVADVYCHATDVPSTSGNAFEYSNIENATLHVPESAISSYREAGSWSEFKTITGLDETKTYTLSISAFGNGSATYGGTTIRGTTSSFNVNEGTSATINFIPDNGNRIKSVKLNNTDVTTSVSNNSYTVDNISSNINVEVTFEAIPLTTYSLSITSIGNGSVTYDGTSIRSKTSSFTVKEGSSVSISLIPDNGYRIKSVKENGTNVISYISSNKYVISSITRNTTVEVEFEAIPPTMRRTLTITASGNGSIQYGSTTVRNQTSSIEVEEGSSATVTFNPDGGNRIATVTVNGQDVTASIENNRYTIANISGDVTIVAAFEEIINAVAYDGVNYTVVSQDEGTVKVAAGNYGQVLTVPASFTAVDRTWQVTGIEADALKDNVGLAAVIWDTEVAFTATVSNPNLLLYVKSEAYAPQAIHNVVVNGTAANITLVEAVDGNDFYCPQSFTAQHISFTHNYQMQTGLGESKGWETIALPFDVQTVTHSTKGSVVPFANWKNGDTSKPFWLYELTGTGFVEAGSIKAYTPYIISMPNNPQYDSQWLLSGIVTFAASNVTVGMTDNVQTSQYQERTFVPNFQNQEANQGLYALNVVNDYCANNSGMTEGSKFVLNMRRIHPFEAYMMTASNIRYAIGVFDDMTTGIRVMVDGSWMMGEAVYDLQGRKVESPSTKGVYIMNGKKKIIK